MWKRRRTGPEAEEEDVVIDLRERLDPYVDVEPAAIHALRRDGQDAAAVDAAASEWAIPSDWLRAP